MDITPGLEKGCVRTVSALTLSVRARFNATAPNYELGVRSSNLFGAPVYETSRVNRTAFTRHTSWMPSGSVRLADSPGHSSTDGRHGLRSSQATTMGNGGGLSAANRVGLVELPRK